MLAAARPRDTLTLWNLLGDADPEARRVLHARILELRPDATFADAGAVIAGDAAAVEALWVDLAAGW